MPVLGRRKFLKAGVRAVAFGSLLGCHSMPPGNNSPGVQPIRGSWISIWWDDRRHFYWNEPYLNFTAEQWQLAVKDMADIGLEYLVLMAVAKGGKAFYDTPLLPKLEMACADPIGALFDACDKYGVKLFISSDWYGDWDDRALLDSDRMAKRFQMMREVASIYAGHRSFYGWYWPNEAGLMPYFTEDFVRHANTCSHEARQLTPNAKILTAPYFTHKAVCDDNYVRQLEKLDVDIIAYQDEVGCLRMTPAQSGAAFEKLRCAHDRVPQRALWADVEVFAWEGPPNEPTSPLIPAPFARVRAQLEAVSPYVEKILIYQYQGLMNKPGGRAFAGHPQSTKLYEDYKAWLGSA